MNWNVRVHRESLLSLLGYPSGKIPAGEDRTVENVAVPARDWDPVTRRWITRTVVTTTVRVRPSKPLLASNGRRRKSSAHRVTLVCPTCRREVPYGRFHQHAGTKACTSRAVAV